MTVRSNLRRIARRNDGSRPRIINHAGWWCLKTSQNCHSRWRNPPGIWVFKLRSRRAAKPSRVMAKQTQAHIKSQEVTQPASRWQSGPCRISGDGYNVLSPCVRDCVAPVNRKHFKAGNHYIQIALNANQHPGEPRSMLTTGKCLTGGGINSVNSLSI